MADQNLVSILLQGKDAWNSWRMENPAGTLDLRGADLSESKLHRADLSGVNLSGANLSKAEFINADLSAANLTLADLKGTNLQNTKLAYANLSGATLDNNTTFYGAETEGCIVDRYQLERLDKYGSLTVGNRMSMHIIDGVAELRAS